MTIDDLKTVTDHMLKHRIYYVRIGDMEIELQADSFTTTPEALTALDKEKANPKRKVTLEDGVFGQDPDETDEDLLFHSA